MFLNKKLLTEADIRTKFILPALIKTGWDSHFQILEEKYFTAGEIKVKGKKTKREKGKKADYILFYKPRLPLAIVEAKDNNFQISDGMQQALEYGEILDIPFIFTSNGDGFCFHNRFTGKEKIINLNDFPSPHQLWRLYKEHKGIGIDEELLILQEYHTGQGVNDPRYYQRVAINRIIEAIANNQKRLLLVMATGTGKTYTAFQIIHRLWKSQKAKRILFLADRTSLISQTRKGDFKHFGDKMTVVNKKGLARDGKAHEIYLALYQSVVNSEEEKSEEEEQSLYRQFSPEFFDLIVIDECHRGSANENGSWRNILNYFSSATQIGMTATPKETKDVSSSEYFGDPIYIYSLKQGIEDGFLAPYKVFRITTNVDMEGWRPTDGQTSTDGTLVEDKVYESSDFDQNLVIKERVEIVARSITEFLVDFDPMAKTIVFCVNQAHAERLRLALVNQNSDRIKVNSKYVMKITSNDSEGKDQIDNFIDPESAYPVIVTTSDLLSTGVDTKTVKVIVLDANIRSMTKFKQIIGRGTRVEEDYNKMYFNILDFRKNTNKFADPDFDGQAVRIKEFVEGEAIVDEEEEDVTQPEETTKPTKVEMPFENPEGGSIGGSEPRRVVIVEGVDVSILFQREVVYNANGKVMTLSLKDYTKNLLVGKYRTLNNFQQLWKGEEQKQKILDELQAQDVDITEITKLNDGEVDIFDTLCYIAFDAPLTRKENRAKLAKEKLESYQKYSPTCKKILMELLDKYADSGVIEILTPDVLKLEPFKNEYTPMEIFRSFGGYDEYQKAVQELVGMIY